MTFLSEKSKKKVIGNNFAKITAGWDWCPTQNELNHSIRYLRCQFSEKKNHSIFHYGGNFPILARWVFLLLVTRGSVGNYMLGRAHIQISYETPLMHFKRLVSSSKTIRGAA